MGVVLVLVMRINNCGEFVVLIGLSMICSPGR
jgi:hypothetical protein